MPQVVYVIMANDFPDCVLSDEAKAEAYAKNRNDADLARHPHRRIFYRVHPFKLDVTMPGD